MKLKIAIGEFYWGNAVFVQYTKYNRVLSKMCREILNSLNEEGWNDSIGAFYYCFCFQSPKGVLTIRYKHVIRNFLIDLELNEGIFKYDKKVGGYTLFGTLITRATEIDYAAPPNTLLDGYKFSTKIPRDVSLKSIRDLEANKESYPARRTKKCLDLSLNN